MSFLVEPNEELSIRVAADYFDQGGRGTGSTPIVLDPDNRFGISSAQTTAFLGPTNAIAGRNFNAIPPVQRLDNDYWGVSATLDWSTGFGTFTLLPAYRESHLDTVGTAIECQRDNIEDESRRASRRDSRRTWTASSITSWAPITLTRPIAFHYSSPIRSTRWRSSAMTRAWKARPRLGV